VRLAYVDEAGISNPTHEPWVVVAAILVNADTQLIHLERSLDKLLMRYIPPNLRDRLIFHAAELFNGTKSGQGKAFERNHRTGH